MNLEERLNTTFNDVLRSSGYIFEIINNNKRQSNLITGPNNQLITGAVANQLAQSIAQFDQILDETVSKFNDARWCVEQIVDNRQKQEELKAQEELERQKKELERKRKEEEEAARLKKEQEEKLVEENRLKELERDAKEKERREKEQQAKAKDELSQNDIKSESNSHPTTSAGNNSSMGVSTGMSAKTEPSLMDNAFDLDLDLGKDQDLLNPSDILSTISYKDGNNGEGNKLDSSLDNMDLDFDAVLNGGEPMMDGLNMDLLDQDFDMGGGMEEEFDVDNFLNQIGNGD